MNKKTKNALIFSALFLAVFAVVIAKNIRYNNQAASLEFEQPPANNIPEPVETGQQPESDEKTEIKLEVVFPENVHGGETVILAESEKKLPMLLELGSQSCVPCKMMMPILADFKENYGDKLNVRFIDVWKNRDQAVKYGINSIPMQLFFDEDGEELFRHTGFFSKDEIIAKWRELGYDLESGK